MKDKTSQYSDKEKLSIVRECLAKDRSIKHISKKYDIPITILQLWLNNANSNSQTLKIVKPDKLPTIKKNHVHETVIKPIEVEDHRSDIQEIINKEILLEHKIEKELRLSNEKEIFEKYLEKTNENIIKTATRVIKNKHNALTGKINVSTSKKSLVEISDYYLNSDVTKDTKEILDLIAKVNQLHNRNRVDELIVHNTHNKNELFRDINKYIGFKPHYHQYKVLSDIDDKKTKFFVVCAGRRSGKTILSQYILLQKANEKPNSILWWVTPTYDIGKRVFLSIREWCNKIEKSINSNKDTAKIKFIEKIAEFPMPVIELYNGSRIHIMSAVRPEGLQGEGVDFMVIDEAASIKGIVWEQYLHPTLMDKRGKCIFISTPKGLNYFYDLYRRGENKEKGYKSYHFTTLDNDMMINTDEIKNDVEQYKRDHPESLYKQEMLAEFVSEYGSIFKNLMECVLKNGVYLKPVANLDYFVGVDLGKDQNYTFIVVMNRDRRVVYTTRFNIGTDGINNWSDIKTEIIKVVLKYNNALCAVDATSNQSSFVEELQREHIRVKSVKFTQQSKNDMVEKLMVDISENRITIPEVAKILINELTAYGIKDTSSSSGLLKYQTSGKHDDGVDALLMCNVITPNVVNFYGNYIV